MHMDRIEAQPRTQRIIFRYVADKLELIQVIERPNAFPMGDCFPDGARPILEIRLKPISHNAHFPGRIVARLLAHIDQRPQMDAVSHATPPSSAVRRSAIWLNANVQVTLLAAVASAVKYTRINVLPSISQSTGTRTMFS